jgi:hypothetical protein
VDAAAAPADPAAPEARALQVVEPQVPANYAAVLSADEPRLAAAR